VPEEPGTYNVRVRVAWDGQSVEKVTTIQVEKAVAEIAVTSTPLEISTPVQTDTPKPTTLPESTTTSNEQLFYDGFDDGNTGKWMDMLETGSQSSVQKGELILDGSGLVYAGSNLWQNYSVKADVRLMSDQIDFGIFARAKDNETLYICQYWQDQVWLNKYGATSGRLDTGYYELVTNQTYELKMSVQDQTILCHINGLEVAAAKDPTYTNGKFGFRIVDTKIAIDNVEVYPLP
jgi:hypothetical protein